MIRFFRSIRQQLARDRKTGGYFAYALGEILLVVIGILIALQINNWNQARKDRTYEVTMLTEIAKALESDIESFERMASRMDKLDSAVTEFTKMIHEGQSFTDDRYRQRRERWYYLRTGFAYRYNSGPYEALKASGLDRVSDDSLRNALIRFYDFELPRHEEITKWYDRSYQEQNALLSGLLGDVYIETDENGALALRRKFPDDLLERQEFLNLLNSLSFRSQNIPSYIRSIIPEMQGLADLIYIEIGHRRHP